MTGVCCAVAGGRGRGGPGRVSDRTRGVEASAIAEWGEGPCCWPATGRPGCREGHWGFGHGGRAPRIEGFSKPPHMLRGFGEARSGWKRALWRIQMKLASVVPGEPWSLARVMRDRASAAPGAALSWALRPGARARAVAGKLWTRWAGSTRAIALDCRRGSLRRQRHGNATTRGLERRDIDVEAGVLTRGDGGTTESARAVLWGGSTRRCGPGCPWHRLGRGRAVFARPRSWLGLGSGCCLSCHSGKRASSSFAALSQDNYRRPAPYIARAPARFPEWHPERAVFSLALCPGVGSRRVNATLCCPGCVVLFRSRDRSFRSRQR